MRKKLSDCSIEEVEWAANRGDVTDEQLRKYIEYRNVLELQKGSRLRWILKDGMILPEGLMTNLL